MCKVTKNCIVEKCKDCQSYGKGGCYYGPKLIVKIFGPMPVPASAWCNRFDYKGR